MKTAEKQLKEAMDFIEQYEYQTGFKFLPELLVNFADAKAKAVLEEAAEKALLKITSRSENFSTTASMRSDGANLITVDKESILSLIKEL